MLGDPCIAVRVTLLALMLCALGCNGSVPPARAPLSAFDDILQGRSRSDFLREMPKGADLHMHLSGSVYAESYMRWAAEDGGCFDPGADALRPSPCVGTLVPASTLLNDRRLKEKAIDAWSARGWRANNRDGHQHFFATFGRFGFPGLHRLGDMLAAIVSQAGSQNVSYLEVSFPAGLDLAKRLSRDLPSGADWLTSIASVRSRLGATELRSASEQLDAAQQHMRKVLRCDSNEADAGCSVELRFIASAGRLAPLREVLAHLVVGCELVRHEPRIVGIGLAQAEDDGIALENFDAHMAILKQLRREYPDVPITLHAGELTPQLVAPDHLRTHIHRAVLDVGVQRIGHASSVLYEPDAAELLRTMAQRGTLVEIPLASNEMVLGLSASRHPLHALLSAGVPVALATDDEGVLRTSLSAEFERAVVEQHLDYATIRSLTHNSIRHAFVDIRTRTQLESRLESDLRSFEARWRQRGSQ